MKYAILVRKTYLFGMSNGSFKNELYLHSQQHGVNYNFPKHIREGNNRFFKVTKA